MDDKWFDKAMMRTKILATMFLFYDDFNKENKKLTIFFNNGVDLFAANYRVKITNPFLADSYLTVSWCCVQSN